MTPLRCMAFLALVVGPAQALPQADWPSWRGSTGTGHARFEKPPTTWSESENIKWKVPIPGLGLSTPIVWRDRIYLTTAVETERPGKADVDEPQHRLALPRPTIVYEFDVVCLDRGNGKVVWRKNVAEAVPHEGGHSTNSHASISPVTDGEFLYANFGSRGLYCLDLDGDVRWKKDLGRMRTRRQYGEASSPALWGNSLVVNWDHEGDSFLVVLDKRTGEERWRKRRDEITSWSTPIVVVVDQRPQIIISATKASRGYDLETGDVVWHLAGMTVNSIPTPVYRDGVVYLMSGYRGRALQCVMLAGARGDLATSPHLRWSYSQRVSYVPSALVYDDHYYFLRGNTGVLTCLDAATGKPHFEGQKLPDIRSVYASPVGANGHVYITSRTGVTTVLKHSKTYEPVATNELDDGVDASLAIAGDEIYLRGRKHMYCIAHTGVRAPEAPAEAAKPSYVHATDLGVAKELTAGLSTADLDGDGDLDLVAANGRHWPGQNKLFLNDGKGGFVEHKLGEPSKSYAAALGDLDGDGDIDIVVGNDREPSRVYWNDGAAKFTAGQKIGRVTSTRCVMLADLDGVNGPDVVFSNRGAANLVCFNDGKRGFGRVLTFGSDKGSTIHTAAGDVNADGKLDLVVANRRGEQNYVYLGDGRGGLSEPIAYGSGKDASRGVTLADVNADGHLDIVNANIGQPNAIYFGDGSGRFARKVELGERRASFAVATADLNADGRLDIVFANTMAANEVWTQGADGTFTMSTYGLENGATYGIVVGDWTGDGRLEIATANSGRVNRVFRRVVSR